MYNYLIYEYIFLSWNIWKIHVFITSLFLIHIKTCISLSIGLKLWKICTPDYACKIFFSEILRTVETKVHVECCFEDTNETTSSIILEYNNLKYFYLHHYSPCILLLYLISRMP